MKKIVLFLIVLLGLAVIGYLTNPTEAMHREAAQEMLEKISENILSDYGIDPRILSTLGVDFQGKLVEELITNHISRDNYYVFSLTKVHWEGLNQVIGLGFFNKVYISNQVDDIIKKEVEDYIKKKIRALRIPILDMNSLKLDL